MKSVFYFIFLSLYFSFSACSPVETNVFVSNPIQSKYPIIVFVNRGMNLVEVTLKRPGRIKSSFQIPPLMSHRMAVAPGPAKISVSFSSKEIPVILKEKKRYVVDIQKYF